MDDLHSRFRLDLSFEVIDYDEQSRVIRFVAKPDPRRYEWRQQDGEEFLFDRLDRMLIPKEMVAQMVAQLQGMPLGYEPQQMGDAAAYVQARRPDIRERLRGSGPLGSLVDPSLKYLETQEAHTLEFVILSVDLVGSTKLVTSLPLDVYRKLVDVLLYELSRIVPLFSGHVLKYTGDGLIAFFPAPTFISKNDLAIDCALAMKRLVLDALHPELVEAGLPELQIRGLQEVVWVS